MNYKIVEEILQRLNNPDLSRSLKYDYKFPYPHEYQFAYNKFNNMNYQNNNRNNYGNNYGNNRSYNNNGYNNYRSNGNQQRQDVKKSGATYTKMRKGKFEGFMAVSAWRKTKAGLMTAKGFPVSDVEHMSEKGNGFLRYAVDVTMNGMTQTYWCLMSTKTQKININELSLVISPNGSGVTSSGKRVTGFFGANYKRR